MFLSIHFKKQRIHANCKKQTKKEPFLKNGKTLNKIFSYTYPSISLLFPVG